MGFHGAEIEFPKAKSIQNSAEILKFSPAAPSGPVLRNLRKERNKGGSFYKGGEFLQEIVLIIIIIIQDLCSEYLRNGVYV